MEIEENLINDFLLKKEEAYESEKKLEKYFREKIKKDLEQAKVKSDFEKIKWSVAPMPECASKVLIFRTILMIEEEMSK